MADCFKDCLIEMVGWENEHDLSAGRAKKVLMGKVIVLHQIFACDLLRN